MLYYICVYHSNNTIHYKYLLKANWVTKHSHIHSYINPKFLFVFTQTTSATRRKLENVFELRLLFVVPNIYSVVWIYPGWLSFSCDSYNTFASSIHIVFRFLLNSVRRTNSNSLFASSLLLGQQMLIRLNFLFGKMRSTSFCFFKKYYTV